MESLRSNSTVRASPWEWAQVALLAANLGWTTLGLGGFLAETMVVTVALNGLLLAVHLTRSAAVGRRDAFHPAGFWLLPFLAYAAVNAAWITPAPWLGWRDWLGWAQMIAVFWVVLNDLRSGAARRTLVAVLIALAATGVAMGCYQRFVQPEWLMLGRRQAIYFLGRASGPFGIPNSLAALLLLVLPTTLALATRRGATAVQRVLFGYLAAVFALGLVLTVSRGAWLALVVALTAWPMLASDLAWKRRLVRAAGVLVVVLALGAAAAWTMPLARERLALLGVQAGELTRPVMWRAAWRIFSANPVTGAGAGSYDVWFERHRPEGFLDDPLWAHNEYLNTLSDYGVVGFVLLAGGVAMIAARVGRAWPKAGAGSSEDALADGLAVGLAAFALQAVVDFSLKIPALAMSAAAVAALVVQRRWSSEPRRPRPPAMAAALPVTALGVMIATVALAMPLYRTEAWRYAARRAIDRLAADGAPMTAWRPVLERARAELSKAVGLAPSNGAAWSDLSYATAAWAHLEPEQTAALGRAAERAADEALRCSSVVPEFWVRRGVALDLQGRRDEAGAAFVRALQLAPRRADVWYHHAFHLALDPNEPGRARAAVAFCLRLDPGNREAQALRERLTEGRQTP